MFQYRKFSNIAWMEDLLIAIAMQANKAFHGLTIPKHMESYVSPFRTE